MTIPRSSISLELLIFFPFIFKTKEVFCLSPRIINWNLLGFAFRELAWNQLSTFSRSYLRSEKIVSNFLSNLYNVFWLKNFWFYNIEKQIINKYIKKKRPKYWALWDADVYVKPRTEGWSYLSPLFTMISLNWFRKDHSILT